MKQHRYYRLWPALAMLLLAAACKKHTAAPAPPALEPRTVNYVLYTDQNFAGNHDTIRFEIYMKSGSLTLMDSLLAPMTIEQIPTLANKIDIQKIVPEAHRNDLLDVGFLYSIDNVGSSWYLDSSNASTLHKIVNYNFR